MKFKMEKWLEYRKKAHSIGNYILDTKKIIYDEQGNFKKYKLELHKEELEFYIEKITAILKESDNYLKQTELKFKEPLWKYKVDDPTTHKSSQYFSYHHMIK